MEMSTEVNNIEDCQGLILRSMVEDAIVSSRVVLNSRSCTNNQQPWQQLLWQETEQSIVWNTTISESDGNPNKMDEERNPAKWNTEWCHEYINSIFKSFLYEKTSVNFRYGHLLTCLWIWNFILWNCFMIFHRDFMIPHIFQFVRAHCTWIWRDYTVGI